MRIPIIRRDADGTIVDGTCACDLDERGLGTMHDFRDLSGEPLVLPPGSAFEFAVDVDLVREASIIPPPLDPDSPHWIFARLPKRERRRIHALSRRALVVAAGGGMPDDDLEYCEMQVDLWGRSVRGWRRAGTAMPLLLAIEAAWGGFDVLTGLPWAAVAESVLFAGTSVVALRRRSQTHERRRDAERYLAYYIERVKALS